MSVSSPATTSAALAEKRMYDVAGACGLVADPSRGIALCRLDPLVVRSLEFLSQTLDVTVNCTIIEKT